MFDASVRTACLVRTKHCFSAVHLHSPVKMQARQLSHSLASTSGQQVLPALRPCSGLARNRRTQDVCRQAVPERVAAKITPFDYAAETMRSSGKHNSEPDFDDPDWYEKVTDWNEFWNYTRWDMEAESLAEEVDAAGNPNRDGDRLYKMIHAMRAVETRPDVVNFLPPLNRRQHVNVWDEPPVEPEKQEENPAMNLNDARALAEKRRTRELMDLEWRRRQAKLGQATYENPAKDVRLAKFAWQETKQWTHEDIYNLITQDGTACRPEDHKAIVENPLAPIDYVNTMGVQWIEETEEFLERIGHLATPDDELRLNQEVVVDLLRLDMPDEMLEAILEPEMAEREAALERLQEKARSDNTWTGDH